MDVLGPLPSGSGDRRRSEVAAARVDDLVPVDGGYLFHLRRSKTDQAGEGVELWCSAAPPGRSPSGSPRRV